jgi:acetate kinase
MRVLVVNAGSSSLKLSALDGERLIASEALPAPRAEVDRDAIAAAVARLGDVDAVGHRIVHGGTLHRAAVRIDADVLRDLEGLRALAPLHQAKSLAALAATTEALGAKPAIACFDTAFHATLPPAAHTYALPLEWRRRWGLRKYGFHGLAHASAARSAAALLGRPLDGLRLVTCHLGGGASLAAVQFGRSVDTTMGFTPLDGLVMATRSGSIDPGLLLWLLEETGLGERDMARALEHESGVLALAGEADMRAVTQAARQGGERALIALEVYVHHLRAGIAAMAAAMDGLDALVFSGGVGEHSDAVRSGAADGLGFLGVRVDGERNRDGVSDRDVSATNSPVRTLVVSAREDLEIARQVHEVLGASL